MMQPETSDRCIMCDGHNVDCHFCFTPVTVGPTIIVCNCEPTHGVHAEYCPSSQRASAAKA